MPTTLPHDLRAAPLDGSRILASLRAAVDRDRLAEVLPAALGRTPDPRVVEAVREAAISAITFRLLCLGRAGGRLVQSAPPLEPEWLEKLRPAVLLQGIRSAVAQAGLASQLHPESLQAALTSELASIAREGILEARRHGCVVCPSCVTTAAQRTSEEAELALALVEAA